MHLYKGRAGVMLALLCCALLCWAVPATVHAQGQNLLSNASFEDVDTQYPLGWEYSSYQTLAAFGSEQGGRSGDGYCIVIDCAEGDDARFSQKVAVQPDTLYRLSGYIKAERVTSVVGANLSIENTYAYSPPVTDTAGAWQYVELYGRTGADQKTLTVYARIGGYGAEGQGTAWFDDLALEPVDLLPPAATQQSFATLQPVAGGDDDAQRDPFDKYLGLILMVTLGFFLAFIVALKRLRGSKPQILQDAQPDNPLVWIWLLAAFAIRCVLAVAIRGYPNDISCWLGWSARAADNLFGMYQDGGFLDYPPGYMYVLFVLGHINRLLPEGSALTILVVKLPAMICDIVTAYIIYRAACRRLGNHEALALSMLYVFNPLVMVDSAAWGQIDSVLTLLVLACLYLVRRDKLPWAAMVYAVGVLVKPQMLLFAPIMLLGLIVAAQKQQGAKRRVLYWLATLGAGVGTLVLLSLPFIIVNGLPWLLKLYMGTLSGYEYATINAANLFALLGGNWQPDMQRILGIPYKYLGIALMVAVSVFVAVRYLRERSNRRVFLWAAVLLCGMFALGYRMHERYMFPAVALMLFYYIQSRDRRALRLFGALSIVQFLNVALVLANANLPIDTVRFGNWIAFAKPNSNAFWVILLSLGTLACFGYLLALALRAESPLAAPPLYQPRARMLDELTPRCDADTMYMKRRDWRYVGILTAVYAVVSLVYLGTANMPQTVWTSQRTGEYVDVDLGSEQEVAQLWHYYGLSRGAMQISASDDGVNWQAVLSIDRPADSDNSLLRWRTDTIDTTARYFRFETTRPVLRTHEVAFFAPDGTRIEPVGILGSNAAQQHAAALLIDEQPSVPANPSHLNGTYFDEIYHVRTAWEHLERIHPYETTHPPLGKVLIAGGIALFGLNTFGWRFAGTVAGILMIPAMYMLAKALFRRTRYALIAALLLSFDFMHFVQTRIATIDSFSVLFIICMLLFMCRYVQINYNTRGLKPTLLPLALCGVSFGLGAASKWICLYAGAGLAVMLFYTLYRRYVQYRAAVQGDPGIEPGLAQRIRQSYWRNTALTLLWCVLFFVIVPVGIYIASYIPFMLVPGAGHDLHGVWENQLSMFRYHSQLVDSHPYASPWYEWPLMIKPMFFYKNDYLPQGRMGSIATFGNPAVWWVGLAAFVSLCVRTARTRRFDWRAVFIIAALLTQFLPWVLVPRSTFIYHYFASVPLLILAIVAYIRTREQAGADKRAVLWYLGVVAALFIAFYPVLSGMPIPSAYGKLLRWLPTWWFVY